MQRRTKLSLNCRFCQWQPVALAQRSLLFDKETKNELNGSLTLIFFNSLSTSFCFFSGFYHSEILGSFQCAHITVCVFCIVQNFNAGQNSKHQSHRNSQQAYCSVYNNQIVENIWLPKNLIGTYCSPSIYLIKRR